MGVSDTTEQDWEEYYKQQLDDTIHIHTNGLEEGIRCALCRNRIKTNRGCDGGCIVNEDDVNRILKVINTMKV